MEEKKKASFWGNCWKLLEIKGNILASSLTHVSEQLSIPPKSYYFFAKTLAFYETGLMCAVTMPLHQAYSLTYIYSCK